MAVRNYDALDNRIKQDALFCLWKYETRGNRKTKVPYQFTGAHADSTNKGTFTDYETAVKYLDYYDGIGMGIFADFFAVDIDHCVDGGKLTATAKDIIETIASYTEYSPSGTGIRIIGKIDAETIGYDAEKYYINNSKLGVEIYVAGVTKKFVTLTGNTLAEYPYNLKTVTEDVLISVLNKYMLRPRQQVLRDISDVPGSMLSDKEVLKMAKAAKNAAKFKKLWNGSLSKGKTGESQQEYDLALCMILAFWCGGDAEQIDRLFRQSGLYREKWERDDYRNNTIVKAITGCESFYQPSQRYSSKEAMDVLQKLKELDPASNAKYDFRDLGCGRLYADVFKDQARYVPERKKWYVYDGCKWTPDVGNMKAMELCKSLADAMLHYAADLKDKFQKDQWVDNYKRWAQRRFREIFLKEAQSIYPIAMDEFDANKYLLNVENGTLNLQTMEFTGHNPADKLTKLAPVTYDPYARNARWTSFIAEVMSNDMEKARFLQKSLGYGLSGDTRHECMFFLYGETTRNGKGTLMESIMRVVGDYGRATRPETIAQRPNANSQAPSEDIARLAGIRIANISEPSRGLLLNTAQVKSMTGNDSINARFLHENSFDFRPQFKLYINTNYLPVINDMTLFSSGRIIVIPFDRHFEEWEQDKELKDEFAASDCQSAILNWLIEGFRALNAEGFGECKAVKRAIEKYEYESNKLVLFAEDELQEMPGYRIRTSDVYTSYSQWCQRNGYFPESMRNFLHELRKFGTVLRARPSDGGEKTTVLEGYELIDRRFL